MKTKSSIALVSCGKRKLQQPSPAKDLYTSTRFRAARKFSESFADDWFILSAKHGLISPDEIVAPYDLDLRALNENQKLDWALSVFEELSRRNLLKCNVTLLARGDYSNLLYNHLTGAGASITLPFFDVDEEVELDYLNRVNANPKRFRDYKTFYDILSKLNSIQGQQTKFNEIIGKDVEKAGVYFFFEENELTRFYLPQTLRVVRVGTHAVSKGSKSQLWQRLRTHRGNDDGSGSHRSSVFRLHIGSAMLASKGMKSLSWGIGDNANQAVRESERALEGDVSQYLRQSSLSYLPILDSSSPDSDRSYIEMNSIALLTGGGPIDQQSKNWLGNFSPTHEIRKSGLWNVNYVGDGYDPNFLGVFDELVQRYERHELTEKSLAPANWRIHMQRGSIGQKDLF
jgi:hypothetical protein